MHGNTLTGMIHMDAESGYLEEFRRIDEAHAPFLGNAEARPK